MPRAPVVSALARQTIRTAFDELYRTISPGDSRDFVHITLPDVKKAALDIENELAARQSLRYMRRLMPLFKGLEHYSKVVDILCNGTPYLPWIWAPISLILRVASEYVEAFEQIIKGYAGIASSLIRFETLSATFTNDTNFQQTLAVFYADILQFHTHAYKFVRRSGWKLLFLTSWGRFQRRFDNILEDLKNHGTLVDNEASAIHISEAQKMRQDIRTWREESLDQVRKFEEEQTARQHEFITSWLNIDESDQLAIFDAILAEGSEYPGTCDWILRNPKVKSWCQSKPDTAILWLQGTPGSGKSVLATQLVNFMKAAKLFVIRHFCTYLYSSSTMYEQILRSLLIQLLRKDDDLIAHVYEECVLGKKSPTTAVLEQLLQTMLKSMSTEPSQSEYIWVIIDGLDECEPDKQARLVNLINQITKTSVPGSITCKVLISSRSPSVSLNRLRRRQIISLTDEKDSVQGAIRQYIGQRLQSLHEKLPNDVGQEEILEIQNTIATKTDGMFLYARLVLDYLSHNIFFSCDEIQASVNQLPEKLTDFYRKLLTQILVTLDSRSVNRIKSVLGWVAFARRPLRKMELLSAISFGAGDPNITHVAPRYILDLCGSLVEERQDATLAFIHISVKEFLQTPSSNVVIHEEEALQEHGIASIACLLSGVRAFSKPGPDYAKFLKVAKGLHGLHIYATKYWTDTLLSHAAFSSGLDTTSTLFILACQLADELDEAYGSSALCESVSKVKVSDERLAFLKQHPVLHKHIEEALKSAAIKDIDPNLLQEHSPDEKNQPQSNPRSAVGTSALLASYQEVVRELLSQHTYPGVSAEELDLFKTHFRASAFTCRLGSCFRATLGFESEKACLEHEMSHARCLRCTFPGCQYPPFVSAQALRKHTSKYHSTRPSRTAIRNPRQIDRTNPSQMLVKASKTLKQHAQEQRAHHQQLAQQQPHTTIGLELYGTPNKDQKPQEGVPSMGVIDSEQDHNPIIQLRQQQHQQQQMVGTLVQAQIRDKERASYDRMLLDIVHREAQQQQQQQNPPGIIQRLTVQQQIELQGEMLKLENKSLPKQNTMQTGPVPPPLPPPRRLNETGLRLILPPRDQSESETSVQEHHQSPALPKSPFGADMPLLSSDTSSIVLPHISIQFANDQLAPHMPEL